jgi:ATP-dependent Clp protease ATP-binding subunit ClpA
MESTNNEVTILSPVNEAGFESCGNAFADSEVTADEALKTHARLLGDKPSYALWENGRIAWSRGYSTSKGYKIDDDATVKAWSRFAKRLEIFNLKKPKNEENPETVKKAEQREKAKQVTESLKDKTFEELETEVAMLLAKPTLSNVNKSKPLLKAIEEKRKDSVKDQMEAIKAMQTEIVALVKKCIDVEQLESIQSILNGNNFEESVI